MRALARLLLRRVVWKPTYCPTCRKRLDWNARLRTAPSLLLLNHGLKHAEMWFEHIRLVDDGLRRGIDDL